MEVWGRRHMYEKVPFFKELTIPLLGSSISFHFETLHYFSYTNSGSEALQPLWKANSRADKEGGAQHKLSTVWSCSLGSLKSSQQVHQWVCALVKQ